MSARDGLRMLRSALWVPETRSWSLTCRDANSHSDTSSHGDTPSNGDTPSGGDTSSHGADLVPGEGAGTGGGLDAAQPPPRRPKGLSSEAPRRLQAARLWIAANRP